MSDTPYISVIIPAYNDSERLGKCLNALASQTYPSDSWEAVVVDNNSAEAPADLVSSFPFARLITESRPGSYAARNAGIGVARGDILAFTDSDCLPDAKWLECGVRHLLSDIRCGLVGGHVRIRYRDPEKPTPVEIYEAVMAFPQKRYIEVDHFGVTANVFTRRAVFDHVGKFNADLKSGGDLEWGRRVYEAGHSVIYAEDSIVDHPARRTFREIRSKMWRTSSVIRDLQRLMPDNPSVNRNPLRRLKPPLGIMVRIMRDRQLGPLTQRFYASFITCCLRYVVAVKVIREHYYSRIRIFVI